MEGHGVVHHRQGEHHETYLLNNYQNASSIDKFSACACRLRHSETVQHNSRVYRKGVLKPSLGLDLTISTPGLVLIIFDALAVVAVYCVWVRCPCHPVSLPRVPITPINSCSSHPPSVRGWSRVLGPPPSVLVWALLRIPKFDTDSDKMMHMILGSVTQAVQDCHRLRSRSYLLNNPFYPDCGLASNNIGTR